MTDVSSVPGAHPASERGAEAAAGGHRIPARIGSPLTQAPRKRRTGVILTALGVIVVAAVCGIVQLLANLGYDDARTEFRKAAAVAADHQDDLTLELDALEGTTAAASTIVGSDSGQLLDAASRDALAAALADAEATASDAETTAAQPLPDDGEKPTWAWELFGATAQLNADRVEVQERSADFTAADREVESIGAALEDAGITALESAASAAAGFEAAHVSARNLDIIALRAAAEDLAYYSTALDGSAALAYADLETAAAQVPASEQAELAEKAGPLQSARLEVEAFARGLAPGVLLDFDWAPTVNGFGYDGSMGGYATWWYADPGYSTLQFSNSVAEQWPSDRSKALIAHEVGHAISVKCEGMYDDSNQDSIEAWATAWAISMGFHDDANGTWAYGAPPQSMIDAAAGCR